MTQKNRLGELIGQVSPYVKFKGASANALKTLNGTGKVHDDLLELYRIAANLGEVSLEEGSEWLSCKDVGPARSMLARAKEFPLTLVPIATDGAGNYACSDAESGAVLDWDHETREAQRLAKDLASFLKRELVRPLLRAQREKEAIKAEGAKAARRVTSLPENPRKIVRQASAALDKLGRRFSGGTHARFLSADQIVVGNGNGSSIWQLARNEQVVSLSLQCDRGIAVAHDKCFVAAGFDQMALCDASSYQLLSLWSAPMDIQSVAINQEGTLAASCGADGELLLWDVGTRRGLPKASKLEPFDSPETGTPLRKFKTPNCKLSSVAFHPEGNRLAVGGWDRSVSVFETLGKQTNLFNDHTDEDPWDVLVAFDPSGKWLVSGSGDDLVVRDEAMKVMAKMKSSNLQSLAFVKPELLVGVGTEVLSLWRIPTGECLGSVKSPGVSVDAFGASLIVTGPLRHFELR